ncbi:hypothetical protein PM082_012589 [Marasmius tenuissimus]|nr:hypothetical protein PM082_012589 [Marasmius tenuissimus]
MVGQRKKTETLGPEEAGLARDYWWRAKVLVRVVFLRVQYDDIHNTKTQSPTILLKFLIGRILFSMPESRITHYPD